MGRNQRMRKDLPSKFSRRLACTWLQSLNLLGLMAQKSGDDSGFAVKMFRKSDASERRNAAFAIITMSAIRNQRLGLKICNQAIAHFKQGAYRARYGREGPHLFPILKSFPVSQLDIYVARIAWQCGPRR